MAASDPVNPGASGAVPSPAWSISTTPPPFHPPQYTMKEIYAAIPPHCFRSNTFISLAYVVRDLLFAFTLALLASHIPPMTTNTTTTPFPANDITTTTLTTTQHPSILSSLLSHHLTPLYPLLSHLSPFLSHPSLRRPLILLAWATYTILQGLILTGIWELAHEAGHGALSPHRWANHAIGLPLHSALLTPYHSWRFTHQTHHKHTNHLEKDIAFVPDTAAQHHAARSRSRPSLPFLELVQDTPLAALATLLIHQLIAFPLYLTLNNFALERMRAVAWWKRSHFYAGGDGPNFRPRHFWEIVISDLGIAVAVVGLWMAGARFGWGNVLLFYGVPYLWTNHWILTITFLHHTDFALPYYPPSSFTFLRGAASTIDRDFGFIGKHFFHGAINTHVLHHHCCKIPFYHAQEASNAMRKVMGDAYISDFQGSYLAAFWRNYTTCKFVEPAVTGKETASENGVSQAVGEGEVYFFNGSGKVVAKA